MKPSNTAKSATVFVSGLSAIALTVVASAAFAESLETENRVAPTVSFAQAMNVATGAAPGDLMSLEIDHSGDTPVYMAELEGMTSHAEVLIDGMSGEVLSSNVITAASPEALHTMIALQDEHGDEHGKGHDAHDAFDEHGDDHSDEHDAHDARDACDAELGNMNGDDHDAHDACDNALKAE